eukprot:2446184-Pleurochrysis_carterae.AAC.4
MLSSIEQLSVSHLIELRAEANILNAADFCMAMKQPALFCAWLGKLGMHMPADFPRTAYLKNLDQAFNRLNKNRRALEQAACRHKDTAAVEQHLACLRATPAMPMLQAALPAKLAEAAAQAQAKSVSSN